MLRGIEEVNLNSIFGNDFDNDILISFKVTDSSKIDFKYLEEFFFIKDCKLIIVLYLEQFGQFMILIREYGLYNYIYKGQINIGGIISPNDWLSSIVLTDMGDFADKADSGSIVEFNNSCCYLVSNSFITKTILIDLCEVIKNSIVGQLLVRIDNLLIENNQLFEQNSNAANIIQNKLTQDNV